MTRLKCDKEKYLNIYKLKLHDFTIKQKTFYLTLFSNFSKVLKSNKQTSSS